MKKLANTYIPKCRFSSCRSFMKLLLKQCYNTTELKPNVELF